MKKVLLLLVTVTMILCVTVQNVSVQASDAPMAAAPDAKKQGGKVIDNQNAKINLVDDQQGQSGGLSVVGDKIEVYRQSLCGSYRFIGYICASKFDNIPGDDYVLVKKCSGKYYWLKVVC
ncbi:MAG: hypothetical protein LBC02_00565, partial [Planctomycetaceae bacterium]|nr:hypothetical protein [Planctomycetaceae bacterium]